jgi:NTP pyrophosphatase (non-canonical NTP hydrolase)
MNEGQNRTASAIQHLVDVCHGASRRAGWWETPGGIDLIRIINNPGSEMERVLAGALVAQKLCLGHSEISEAMEGHRKNLMDDHLPHRKMVEVELADALIRICDLAGALGMDLGGAAKEKLAFNAQREDHKMENRVKENGKGY